MWDRRRETQAEAAGTEAQPQLDAAGSAGAATAEAEAAPPLAAGAAGIGQQQALASDAPTNGAAVQAASPALDEKTQAFWRGKLMTVNSGGAVPLLMRSHAHRRYTLADVVEGVAPTRAWKRVLGALAFKPSVKNMRAIIVALLMLPVFAISVQAKVVGIALGGEGFPALLDDNGDVWVFEEPYSFGRPVKLQNLSHIVKIAPFIALDDAGRVFNWSPNYKTVQWGSDGEYLTVKYMDPVKVNLPKKAITIASAGRRFAAVDEEGNVYEWGKMFHPEKSDKERWSNESPQKTLKAEHVLSIALSDYTTAALVGNNKVIGWGVNDQGQLGSDRRKYVPQESPASIELSTPSAFVYLNDEHLLVMTIDSKVAFFGNCRAGDDESRATGTVGLVDDIKDIATPVYGDYTMPNVFLRRDGSVIIEYSPVPDKSNKCRKFFSDYVEVCPQNGPAIDGSTVRKCQPRLAHSLIYRIPGMATPAVATSIDKGTILALGEDGNLWVTGYMDCSFRCLTRTFQRISVKLQ